MRGNAWECVVLCGKLLQVRFLDTDYPGEGCVGCLIWMVGVLALPSLKFCAGLIASLAPNVFLGNPLARFAANLFDVSLDHRAPSAGMTPHPLRCLDWPVLFPKTSG